MRPPFPFPALAPFLALAVVACVGPETSHDRFACASDADCASGHVCLARFCRAPGDEPTHPDAGSRCTPHRCDDLGASCGELDDGCGGTLSCGTCAGDEVCGSGEMANRCCVPEPTGAFCAHFGAECGALTAPDNCGHARSESCAGCAIPLVCGEGASANRCVCSVLGCDDRNPCTDDGCAGQDCRHVPANEGAACDGQNPRLRCLAGACVERYWSKSYAIPNLLDVVALRETSDGGFVVLGDDGASLADASLFVLKVSATGETLWQTRLVRAGGARPGSLEVVGPDVYVAGSTNTGTAPYDELWVTKLDAGGTRLWDRLYGTGGHDWVRGTATRAGHLLLLGITNDASLRANYLLELDANGGVVGQRSYGGPGVTLNAVAPGDDGVVLAGTDLVLEGSEMAIARVTSTGGVAWHRFVGEPAPKIDRGTSLYALGTTSWLVGSQQVQAAGASPETTEGLVTNVQGDGTVAWTRAYFGALHLENLAKAVPGRSFGNLLLGGTVATAGNTRDVWLVEVDGNGLPLANGAASFGSAAVTENFRDLVRSTSGDPVVAALIAGSPPRLWLFRTDPLLAFGNVGGVVNTAVRSVVSRAIPAEFTFTGSVANVVVGDPQATAPVAGVSAITTADYP